MNRLLILLAFLLCVPASAQTIKKCQDADGKWHYGDQAAEECERSRITVIDQSGEQIEHIEVPETREERAAKKEMEEKLAEQDELKQAQQALDHRLLATYENEDSIIRTRDALMAAIDSAIETDEIMKRQLVKDLEEEGNADKATALRVQIEEFDKSIRDRLATKESARARYQLELTRFQELTKPRE